MKTWEYIVLISVSWVLAFTQSLNVEGGFKYVGYIMWAVVLLVFLVDILVDSE